MGTDSFLSAEWFAEKAKEEKYITYGDRAQEQLSRFNEKYGIDQLKALSGKALLDTMFYNDTDNKENLCYTLEMNSSIKEIFGSISGGSFVPACSCCRTEMRFPCVQQSRICRGIALRLHGQRNLRRSQSLGGYGQTDFARFMVV